MKFIKNKKGFTLAELLIVVAIIGILVAVSIPIFTTQLNKAKDATNASNARAIYAQLTADFLDNGKVDAEPSALAWNGSSDETITVAGNKFKFTAVSGASLSISVGTEGISTGGTAPTVTYTHATAAGGQAETFGSSTAGNASPSTSTSH